MKQLHPPAESRTRKKILGRGTSSGKGRTSTKGHKGRKARAGGSVLMGFEGGQMKLVMRMPKVGFSNMPHRALCIPVNLEVLEARFQDGEEVNMEALRARGLLRKKDGQVKLLGVGTLKKKLVIAKGIHASAAARKAIEAAGGSLTA